MRDFFKGWRRKVGSTALLMAVITTVLWIRTTLAVDYGAFPFAGRQHQVMAIQGAIFWASKDGPGLFIEWQTTSPKEIDLYGLLPSQYAKVWEQEMSEGHPRYWILMHWWLVVPLTLLSAYLILWKPRTRPKGAPDA